MSSPRPSDVNAQAAKVLTTHGHAFQYAVLRRAGDLARTSASTLSPLVAEFPFETIADVGHVDFILADPEHTTLVVAECKRADPSRARWLFVRAPYTFRDSSGKETVFDRLMYGPPRGRRRTEMVVSTPEKPTFHIGFDLRTHGKGDGHFASARPIAEAVSQALKGTAGLMNHLLNSKFNRADRPKGALTFIPAIFTTAELWTSDIDISEVNLPAGAVTADTIDARRESWIWLTHHRSPALTYPGYTPEAPWGDLSMALRLDFSRSVAVVGPDGIDEFLQTDFRSWIAYWSQDSDAGT